MKRAFGNIAVSHLSSQVRSLWYSRHDEPEKQEFISLPEWMDQESPEWSQNRDLKRVVSYLLTRVTNDEAFVLTRRYWFEDTYEECGSYLNVTRERIRQIEAKAMRRLKHPSRAGLLALVIPSLDNEFHRAYLEKNPPKDFFEWTREST